MHNPTNPKRTGKTTQQEPGTRADASVRERHANIERARRVRDGGGSGLEAARGHEVGADLRRDDLPEGHVLDARALYEVADGIALRREDSAKAALALELDADAARRGRHGVQV
jgi:hypothetical protein